MKKKKFKARYGSPFPKKDAQKVGEELDSIKKKALLNPENIVERAKNDKSVLHQYFDWDDNIASDKWRLQQARNIVNHVMEVIVIRNEEVEMRGFFNVIASSGEKIYVSQAEAISIPSYKKQLLREMESTLKNLLKLIQLFSSME